MQPYRQEVNLLMMCQDQVIELPPNATVIGQAEKCPHGIMRIGEKLLGIQAHPEFSKAYDQLLLEARVDRIGEEIVNAGLQSLTMEVHREIIRLWILRFIGFQEIS